MSPFLYDGKTLKLRISGKYEIIEHAPACVILPIDSKENVYFVKQHRPAIEKDLIELPAGGLEPHENPLDCAQRELQEEIGYKANQMLLVGKFFATPGFCNEIFYLFLAFELEKSILKPDDDENIEVIKIPGNELHQKLFDGSMEDLKTALGIFYFLEWQKNKEWIWQKKLPGLGSSYQ